MELMNYLWMAVAGLVVLVLFLAPAVNRSRAKVRETEGHLREVEEGAAPYLEGKASVEGLERERRALSDEIREVRDKWDREVEQVGSEIKQLEGYLGVLRGMEELQACGLYRPHYDFGTSEEYREKLDAVRHQQEVLVKAGKAAQCNTEWTLEGSKTKGRQMTERYLKLQPQPVQR